MAFIILSDLWKDTISVSFSPPDYISDTNTPYLTFDLDIHGGFRGFSNCPSGTYQFTNHSIISPSIVVPSPLPFPRPVICCTLDTTENKFIPSSTERVEFFTPLARGFSMTAQLRDIGVIMFKACGYTPSLTALAAGLEGGSGGVPDFASMFASVMGKLAASSLSSSSSSSSSTSSSSSSSSSTTGPKYLTTPKTTFISSDLDEIDAAFRALKNSMTTENSQNYTTALRWYYVHDSIMQENKEFYLKYADKIIEQIKILPILAGKKTGARIWYDCLSVDLMDLDDEMKEKGKILKKVIADAEAQSNE